MIERAYREGEAQGLSVWVEDEAGSYQAVPQAGQSSCEAGSPSCRSHEYVRGNTAKLLTLFHPATGELRAKGVTSSANAILYPWLEGELEIVLARLPTPVIPRAALNRQRWEAWQANLSVKFTLSEVLPPLASAIGLGQLDGPQDAVVRAGAGGEGRDAALYTLEWLAAQHG